MHFLMIFPFFPTIPCAIVVIRLVGARFPSGAREERAWGRFFPFFFLTIFPYFQRFAAFCCNLNSLARYFRAERRKSAPGEEFSHFPTILCVLL
jgi:hypothetical protein